MHPAPRTTLRIALLAALALGAACSRGGAATAEAGAADSARGEIGAELDSVFAGFRLLAPGDQVMAKARGMGLWFECRADEPFVRCSPGLEPAPGRPALSFAFRDDRLVALVRSPRKEKGAPPAGDMAAQFGRAFGDPVVEGWMNDYLHARMYTDADTSFIGSVTCDNPADPATCEAGLDYAAGTNLAGILDEWRGMIERHAATRP